MNQVLEEVDETIDRWGRAWKTGSVCPATYLYGPVRDEAGPNHTQQKLQG